MSDYNERLSDLRDRAYRIYESAKNDPDVSPERVLELETGLQLIEMGWETVENHPNPAQAAPFDLDRKLAEWERQFDKRETELGIE